MKNQEFEISENNGRIKISDFGQAAAVQTLHFAVAVLTASASAEQYFSPLGIAFCGGTKKKTYAFFLPRSNARISCFK